MDEPEYFLTPLDLFLRWEEMGLKISKKTIKRWRYKNEGPPFFRVTDLPRAPIRYPIQGVEEFEQDMFRQYTYD